MYAIALALGAAVGWGVSDFLGGLKSRSVPLLSVLLVSQLTGLVLLLLGVVVRGAPPPDSAALGYAAVAGTAEAVGIAALYRGLAAGTMSIVAPVAATAPLLPVLFGLSLGEVPGPVQGAGIVLAAAGIVVTSVKRQTANPSASKPARSVGYGLLAALGFGAFFVAMDSASEADILWALFVARLTATSAVAAIVVIAIRRHSHFGVRRVDLPVIALIGVLIIAADAMYATATTLGLLGIAAVLGSLHTIVTMGLARVYLKERLEPAQRIGIAAVLLGVLAITASPG
jgi:drug/metabolite transporter (DMT)-like permease